MIPKFSVEIPDIHSPVDKALLLAHLMQDSGNTEIAAIIYEVLILFGETSAMTRMADILSEPPEYINVQRAKELYRQACVGGDYSGCYNLAVLYEQLGDSLSAQKYYALAKARGAPSEEESEAESK